MTKISSLFSHPSSLLTPIQHWLKAKKSWFNYKNKLLWLCLGLVAIGLVSSLTIYRLLHPSITVQPDIKPFETVQAYNQFIADNPLFTAAVPEGKTFTKSVEIRSDKTAIYYIELSQRPLKPQMDQAYIQSYLAYLNHSQQQAKQWIQSLGQNPDELAIIWRPNPEEMRQKLLGESTKPFPQKNNPPTTSPSSPPTPTPNPTSLFPH